MPSVVWKGCDCEYIDYSIAVIYNPYTERVFLSTRTPPDDMFVRCYRSKAKNRSCVTNILDISTRPTLYSPPSSPSD